ncbi:Carboxypeptidase B, partial [Eufriesea mexicana]
RMQSLHVSYKTPEEFSLLKNFVDTPGFDFMKSTSDFVDVMVTADKVEAFKTLLEENHMNYTIMIEDVHEAVTEERITQEVERRLRMRSRATSGKFPFTYYPNYKEVTDYLEYIANTHNDIATVYTIGHTYEGRPMKLLKLSTGEKKRAIFIDGGIHAREWIAPVTALYFIDQIVENNEELLRLTDWYILPVLNPDGYEFTHSRISNRLWRKTRSDIGSACKGVDGNRNYDIAWMTIGASSNPCSDTYAGPKAFSELETTYMSKFILDRKQQIKAYITLHSYGQYILYPWGYTTELPRNVMQLKRLATKCADAIAEYRGTRYIFGTSSNALYPSAGGGDDWAMAKAGINMSFTYELPGGDSGFLLPVSEIKPVGIETFEAMKVIHKHV